MICGYLYFSVDDMLLKDVITPGSKLLKRLALELNQEDNPVVKNWTHLAWKMEVPADMYRMFADVKQKRNSPTKEVLEWVSTQFSEIALSDVAKALDEIQRNDAIQIISKHFPDTIGKYSLMKVHWGFLAASVFAFPEISLSLRCGTFSFLFPSLLFFVIHATISNVHYLVPLVQEMARRKVIGYMHMLPAKDSLSVNVGYLFSFFRFILGRTWLSIHGQL